MAWDIKPPREAIALEYKRCYKNDETLGPKAEGR